MPKASIIKKSQFVKDGYTWNDNNSNSIDLFVACGNSMVNSHNSDTDSKGEEGEKGKKKERNRAQDVQKESRNNISDSEKSGELTKVKRARHKEDVQPGVLEGGSTDGKGKSVKGSAEETDGIGRKARQGKKADSGTGNKTRKGKQKAEGVSGREGREGLVKTEVNWKKFKLVEFEESNTVMSQKPIQYGPFDTGNELEVYIILDGLRYKVSKWSIRDGYYIQGLDSRFLISKLHTKKAN